MKTDSYGASATQTGLSSQAMEPSFASPPDGLQSLARRCMEATEPSRELDVAIWLALCGPADRQSYEEGFEISKEEASFRADYMMGGASYTASLDAAMALMPERLSVTLYCHPSERGNHADIFRLHPSKGLVADSEQCATPALALCAAALKARAAIAMETQRAETENTGSVWPMARLRQLWIGCPVAGDNHLGHGCRWDASVRDRK